jgi:2-(1,2-epoxy-1,2-dihydrophenyl)acetyl-CoA isomerase
MVRFNRPERLNAFDPDVIVELVSHLEELAGDGEIRAVILTGTGRGFCAGGDLHGLRDRPPTTRTEDEQVANMLRLTHASVLLHEMPKLTIAAVNGPCAGAGFSLACAADLRIAAASAVFATAFANAGQTGDYGGTWFLPRLVGAGKARELFLLGGRLDARQAERVGLVNRVVPDDDLLSTARDAALQVSAAAPLALAGLKANLNEADHVSLRELLEHEAHQFVRNAATRDSAEAVRAFLEKRPPVFEGR